MTPTELPRDEDEGGILYEARYRAETTQHDAFDTWLRDRIADVLACPGFLSAEILAEAGTTRPGLVARTVQYRVRDEAAWHAFADGENALLERIGSFGEVTTLERQLFRSREQFQHGSVSTENCQNCGEVLRGQHCLHCGQRARVRVLSLWSLLRDVLGDFLEWDARIWRTLRPLAFRPGFLTNEFLRGRRTHYTPPFRMYLILSVAFFIAASLGEGVELKVDADGVQPGIGEDARTGTADPAPAPGDAAIPVAGNEGTRTIGIPELDPGREALVLEIVDKLPESRQAEARATIEHEVSRLQEADISALEAAAKDPCGPDTLKLDVGVLQALEPRLRDACRRIMADRQGFASALLDNTPRMLFVFLPLIALLMKLLYAGSGRFYVEHLLFFVHYHSYLFLGGLVLLALGLADTVVAGSPVAAGLATTTNVTAAAFVVWSPLYLYLAMRRVYAQGRVLTIAKYTLLGLGYFVGLALTMLGLLLYTALSI